VPKDVFAWSPSRYGPGWRNLGAIDWIGFVRDVDEASPAGFETSSGHAAIDAVVGGFDPACRGADEPFRGRGRGDGSIRRRAGRSGDVGGARRGRRGTPEPESARRNGREVFLHRAKALVVGVCSRDCRPVTRHLVCHFGASGRLRRRSSQTPGIYRGGHCVDLIGSRRQGNSHREIDVRHFPGEPWAAVTA